MPAVTVAADRTCYDRSMESELARFKAHLKLVGDVKAQSHREVTAAHMALPLGQRLEDAVALADFAMSLSEETAHLRPNPPRDDEAETWARVNAMLRRRG